jgi:hypothetical protein
VNQWSVSGVREVLHRDLYRGVVSFGKVRRTGPKTRVKLPKDQWQTRQDESLRIVDLDLWAAARARMADARDAYLRAADGSGRMVGHAEAIVNRYLLSVCSPAVPSDTQGRRFCGSPGRHDARPEEDPVLRLRRPPREGQDVLHQPDRRADGRTEPGRD